MLIGLIGYARSGKDTFAQHMVNDYEFTKLAFADPMREALQRLDPIIRIGDGLTMNLSQALSSLDWEDLKMISPDVRPLMQKMGTEVGREMLGENVWVNLAMKKAEQHDNVVFSDVRFLNEAEAIKAAGGLIFRIVRPGNGPVNEHVSESVLDDYEADFTINNSGTVEDLNTKINVLLAALRAWT